MPLKNYLLALTAAICFLSFQSCKKNESPAPDPVPVIKPDTLTTGWTKQVMADKPYLSDIFFNSATTGYITSSNIYKTSDGGITWNSILTGSGAFNIFINNDSKAFFVGNSNTIRKTIDGGSSFIIGFVGDYAIDIFFIDNNTGYCITVNGLYTTTDGGINWSKIVTTGFPSFGSGYASLYFVNNTTGWVVTPSGIFKSVGGLINWQPAAINGGSPGALFGSLYATSATNIYAANNSGEIFKSTDGGSNFLFLKKLENGYFTDLHFLSDLVGYASSGSHIFKTTDGGINWIPVVSLGEDGFSELHFTDANHGWACASNGAVLIFKQ